MQKITTIAELTTAIQQSEQKQSTEWILLRKELLKTYTNLQPVNLIKGTLKELISAPDLKGDLLNTTLGLASGYLSKKIIVGSTHNPLRQLFGTLLQIGITSIVSKNSGGIKSVVMHLADVLTRKKTPDTTQHPEQ